MSNTATKTKPVAPMRIERRGWFDAPQSDGTTRRVALYHYESDKHVVVVGPHIRGYVQLADGTQVDVSPDVIEVDTLEQAKEISHQVGIRFEEEGHPLHEPTERDPFPEPFVHLCTPEQCGDAARDITHPMQALAVQRAVQRAVAIPDPQRRVDWAQTMGVDVDNPGITMALAAAAAENAALNGLDGTGTTNVIPDVSLHTATPGTTGASETANSGSYARQACSWNAASAGAKTNSTSLTFSTLGTIAVTHIGTWSSATYGAGTYAIGGTLNAAVTSTSITIASGALTFSAS
jgi:hypothetical protein